MTEKITIRINDGLKTLFNVNDPIYKAVICDKEGSLNPAMNSPVRTLVESTLMFYSFDDPTNIAKDDSGNGFNGTPTAITSGPGVFGNAAVFNGTSSRIIRNPSPVTNLTGKSIEFRFKRNGLPGSIERLISNYVDGSNRDFIQVHTSGKLLLRVLRGVSGSNEIYTNSNLCDNNWHHIILKIISSTQIQFVVDNNPESIQTLTVPITTLISPILYLGTNATLTNFLNGSLDEFRIFDRILTPEEDAYLYNNSGKTLRWLDPYLIKPSDFNLGAVTDQLEYLRRLQIDLVKQIFIDQASAEFLRYSLEKFFGSLRLEGETDDDWIQRTISLIFQPRVSRASIIFALRPYSSQEPEIISGGGDAMFADVSFADRYVKYNTMYKGKNFSVYPAIAQTAESAFFSIVIILYDTPSNQLYSVADLINQYIAAGISYTIEIR